MGRRRPFVQPSYLTDHQFSVVAAVGRTGTLAFRVAYDAFGEARHLPAKDVNGDGKVDKTDTTLAQAASGKRLGQPGKATAVGTPRPKCRAARGPLG